MFDFIFIINFFLFTKNLSKEKIRNEERNEANAKHCSVFADFAS